MAAGETTFCDVPVTSVVSSLIEVAFMVVQDKVAELPAAIEFRLDVKEEIVGAARTLQEVYRVVGRVPENNPVEAEQVEVTLAASHWAWVPD